MKDKKKQMKEFGDQCVETAINALDSLIELNNKLSDGLYLESESLSHKDQACLLNYLVGSIGQVQKAVSSLNVNIKTSCLNSRRKIAKEVMKKVTAVSGDLQGGNKK